ncbi:DUF4097 family beta strand repeat-containing protein [Luteimonas sp. M1R5S18]|jgi:DUF4097 and DUF4098 domain-containing protein YvlB|uniref:DUF4097 family beta strand repeat-containing protein n=1 Tax=Luteimonas rhizosphaericola TaxID=3042024 RepID=A0ABT6JH55_9GAMM|nr:DUF4097 family beta strand repeat-containing protein [Luteimonas rhizosphaericola]MDH5830020.1 DUF4097 family beta strand repeat-containing protein [Luteimonas rhizosphaericola]
MKALTLTAALLACLGTAPAFAATPIDETRPLDARGQLEISNVKGRIEVRAWDREEVHITGSLGDGVERLQVEGDRKSLEVKVRYPRNSRDTEPTTLVLQVPRQVELEVDGVAVEIDVNGVAGRSLDIESVSGDVVAVGAPREADISSVSGNLQLNLNSNNVEAESVSGNIALRGRIEGEISAETVSGDIRIDTRGQAARRLSTSTVSGSASYTGGLAPGGRISAESVSGDIRLALPASVSARVSAESFSGDLRAPGVRIDKPKYGPGSSFEHTFGDGAGEIRMETFSGSAELVLE